MNDFVLDAKEKRRKHKTKNLIFMNEHKTYLKKT